MSPPSSPSRRVSFRWPTPNTESGTPGPGSRSSTARAGGGSASDPPDPSLGTEPEDRLCHELDPWARDRVASAPAIVQAASLRLQQWIQEHRDLDSLGSRIEAALAPLLAEQGWRGAVARWMDSMRQTGAWAAEKPHSLAEVLIEELGVWCWSASRLEDFACWDGTPLGAGRRTGDADLCAENAASLLGPRHSVLVHGGSDLVASALECAQANGRDPEVLVSEGGADRSGRWLARRLAKAGMKVTLVYDAALLDSVPRADRVWIGTEAIGASSFLARVGTRRLCETARELDVPFELLALADDLAPGGETTMPRWCADQPWLLWEDAPTGVRLETQLFEEVPLGHVTSLITDVGFESATELHVRALRTDIAPPLSS